MSKLLKGLAIQLIISLLIYFSLKNWQSGVVGSLFLVVYLGSVSGLAKTVIVNFFNFSSQTWRTRLFAVFLCFTTVGYLGGIVILFFGLTALIISLIFLFNGLLWLVLSLWAARFNSVETHSQISVDDTIVAQAPGAKIGVLIYFILLAAGLYLLAISKTGGHFFSPWQTIQPAYIYVFLAATLVLGWLIFSRINPRMILFLLILHSFLLHSYLPLTHELLYGADQWRHLAVEQKLLQENRLDITSYDQNPATWVQSLNPGRLTYNNFWATKVILAKLTNLNLLSLNRWLLPVVFSLVLPLLLFEIGKIFGWDDKSSFLLVWLGFLIFPWQSLGAMTLPVSYGFLIWLLMIILLLKRSERPRWEQIIFLLIFALLSAFGYSLYLILFILSWLVMEIIVKSKSLLTGKKRTLSIVHCLLFIATALFIPIIECLTKYSLVNPVVSFISQVKQFSGNFSGSYLAFGSRPHDILGGNIIFNQTPSFAFVINLFTQWRWWIPVFMAVLLIFVLDGLIISLNKKKPVFTWAAIMGVGLWLSYFFGFYLLDGEKLLSRRLDMTLGLFLLILFFLGLNHFLFSSAKDTLKKVITVIIVCSVAITAAYSLGPDTETVSASEYRAMRYVWSQVKDQNRYCVISDTYPLLALEYFSAQKIIGGGFPIDENFFQPDRLKLLKEIKYQPTAKIWEEATAITKADRCWLVMRSHAVGNSEFYTKNIVSIKQFTDVMVLEYNK